MTVTRYDRTQYKCIGCLAAWDIIDADPHPAINHHLTTCGYSIIETTLHADVDRPEAPLIIREQRRIVA